MVTMSRLLAKKQKRQNMMVVGKCLIHTCTLHDLGGYHTQHPPPAGFRSFYHMFPLLSLMPHRDMIFAYTRVLRLRMVTAPAWETCMYTLSVIIIHQRPLFRPCCPSPHTVTHSRHTHRTQPTASSQHTCARVSASSKISMATVSKHQLSI